MKPPALPVIELRPLSLLGSAAPDAARYGAYRVDRERKEEEELGSYASVEAAVASLRERFPDLAIRMPARG